MPTPVRIEGGRPWARLNATPVLVVAMMFKPSKAAITPLWLSAEALAAHLGWSADFRKRLDAAARRCANLRADESRRRRSPGFGLRGCSRYVRLRCRWLPHCLVYRKAGNGVSIGVDCAAAGKRDGVPMIDVRAYARWLPAATGNMIKAFTSQNIASISPAKNGPKSSDRSPFL